MGIFTGDWTRTQYQNAIAEAKRENRTSVSLSTEHCSWHSDESLRAWALADGYLVEMKPDTVIVSFPRKAGA